MRGDVPFSKRQNRWRERSFYSLKARNPMCRYVSRCTAGGHTNKTRTKVNLCISCAFRRISFEFLVHFCFGNSEIVYGASAGVTGMIYR